MSHLCSHLPAGHLDGTLEPGTQWNPIVHLAGGDFSLPLTFFCRILCAESASNFHFDCLDFDSMMFGAAPARRLSTASSVTKPPHFILTTDWVWYWTDEFGSWQEYGKQVSVMERGQIFSPKGP